MNTLQDLLTILDGQQLSAGSLTPAGGGTALETVIALKKQFDPWTLATNPLPGMTNQPGAPNVLLAPAWIASLAAGQDAIFISDVGGRLDSSKGPAYIFSSGGGGPTPPLTQNYSLFAASLTPTSTNTSGTFSLGIVFTVTKPGQVTAIRFYRISGATATSYQGNIWNATTQAQLGQANFTGLNTTGWQQQNLVTPVSVVPGTRYAASVFFSDGEFGYSSSNPPITGGVLQAPDGTGLFSTNSSPTFPNNNQSNVNYFVDLVLNA